MDAAERRSLGIAIASLLAFGLLGLVVGNGPPLRFDLDLSAAMMAALGSGPARGGLDGLNIAGTLEAGAIVTTALAIVALATRRWPAALAVLSTWIPELAGSGVKIALARPRPPGGVVIGVLGESWSYPSGHVVRATAIVAVLVWLLVRHGEPRRRFRLALAGGLVAGLLVGMARVAVGAHWPTDVIGGLFLGVAFVGAFDVVAGRISRRRPPGAPPPPPRPGPGPASP
jgi:membrane-associated phospholipid phosphatase